MNQLLFHAQSADSWRSACGRYTIQITKSAWANCAAEAVGPNGRKTVTAVHPMTALDEAIKWCRKDAR